MFRIGKLAFLLAGLALAMPFSVGVRSPAQAQASDAALGEFHRSCASQINRYRQSGIAMGGENNDADQRFGQVMSFSGATREGLQRVDTEVTARVQRYVADTSAEREYSVAAAELDHCAVRVGLRFASEGGRPGSPAARPSLDGRWVATNLTNPLGYGPEPQLPELTIVSRPGGFQVTSNVARLNGSFVLESEPPGGRRFRRDLPPGTNHSITSTDESPDYLDFCSGGGYCNSFRRVSGARVASRPAAPAPRVASPAGPPRAPSAPAGPAAAASAALSLGRTDLQASLRELNRLAAAGNSSAQFILGMMYSMGRGVPRDPARALMFMRQAAAQNLPEAVRRLPAIEQQAQRTVTAPAQNPTAGMLPEVAAAWRATTDPATRARIARNAARYAASRPSLVVRANIGSGCIRPDMINVSFDAARESWDADIRLTNTCNTEQFGYADTQMQNGGIAWMPITNVGMYPGRWDQRRDPAVGFRPYNPLGDAPRYRLPAGGNWASNGGGYPGDGRSNQIELWIGSCPSHAAGNVTQIGFRPAANLRDDPRIACVPGIQGRDGF